MKKEENKALKETKQKENKAKTSRIRFLLIIFIAVLAIALSFKFASAADPGHKASSIASGTFESGNFTFPNSIFILSRLGIGITTNPTMAFHLNGSANITGTGAKLYVPEICLVGECINNWDDVNYTFTDTYNTSAQIITAANSTKYLINWSQIISFTDTILDAAGAYLYNDSTSIYLNETKLNTTIDARSIDAIPYQSTAAGWANTTNALNTSKDVVIRQRTVSTVPLTIQSIRGTNANSPLLVMENKTGTDVIQFNLSGYYGGAPWGSLHFKDYAGGATIYSKAGYLAIAQTHATYGFMMLNGAEYGGQGVTATGDFRMSVGNKDLVFMTDNFNDERMRFIDDGEAVIQAINITEQALVVKGKAGQTKNLQEWQTSAGAVLGRFTAGGNLSVKNEINASKLCIGGECINNWGDVNYTFTDTYNTSAQIMTVANESGYIQNWSQIISGTDTVLDAGTPYLYNDSTSIYLNETKLNTTIDARSIDAIPYQSTAAGWANTTTETTTTLKVNLPGNLDITADGNISDTDSNVIINDDLTVAGQDIIGQTDNILKVKADTDLYLLADADTDGSNYIYFGHGTGAANVLYRLDEDAGELRIYNTSGTGGSFLEIQKDANNATISTDVAGDNIILNPDTGGAAKVVIGTGTESDDFEVADGIATICSAGTCPTPTNNLDGWIFTELGIETDGTIESYGDINTTNGDICIEGGNCLSEALTSYTTPYQTRAAGWSNTTTKINTSRNVVIGGTLNVSGSPYFGAANYYLNYDGADADINLYFYEDSSPTAEKIYWDNGGDQFAISDDTKIEGKLHIEVASGGGAEIGKSDNSATGNYAVAMGQATSATGADALAAGRASAARGDYSVATGFGAKATATSAIAFGQGIEASGANTMAIALADETGTNVSQANTLSIMGGKVGIETVSPGEALEVAGNINVTSGDICIEGGNCLSEALTSYTTPYQSSAAGWTNTSTDVTTNLNVTINGILNVTGESGGNAAEIQKDLMIKTSGGSGIRIHGDNSYLNRIEAIGTQGQLILEGGGGGSSLKITNETAYLALGNGDSRYFAIGDVFGGHLKFYGATGNLGIKLPSLTLDIPQEALDVRGNITATGWINGTELCVAGECIDNWDDVNTTTTPYQSSAAGWTNTTTKTSTALGVHSTSYANFTTVDTGQGANELYDMDQNVQKASNVLFNSVNVTAMAKAATLNATTKICMGAVCRTDWPTTSGISTAAGWTNTTTKTTTTLNAVAANLNVSGVTYLGDSGNYFDTNGNLIFPASDYIQFDSADTKISANADDPEDLVITADQDILMDPDNGVGINMSIPGTAKLSVGGNIHANEISTIYGGIGEYENLLNFSEEFDNAAWTTPSDYVVKTADTGTAPDGTETADLLNWTATGIVRHVVALENSGNYVFSAWIRLRKDNSGGVLAIDAGDGTAGSPVITATSDWKRYSINLVTSTANDWLDIRHVGTSEFEFWGAQLEAGTAAGPYVKTGAAAIAEGYGLVTSGAGPHLFQEGNVGIGTNSPGAKLDVEVSTGAAATIGSSTNVATGKYAIAMGNHTTASGNISTAMGWNTTASGDYSTAMGRHTVASGLSSTAMGFASISEASSGVAMGYSAHTSGTFAPIAMGYDTEATGKHSTAMGHQTNASGDTSTALGYLTKAIGAYSTAIGREIIADGDYTVAIALADMNLLNISQANTMAIMGGKVGINASAPQQALTVVGKANITGGIIGSRQCLAFGDGGTMTNGSLKIGDAGAEMLMPYTGVVTAISGTASSLGAGVSQKFILRKNGASETSCQTNINRDDETNYTTSCYTVFAAGDKLGVRSEFTGATSGTDSIGNICWEWR
ncbi:MAG: hypothetical protein V1659_05060 [Candidatus Woesearchaeota archaeon]